MLNCRIVIQINWTLMVAHKCVDNKHLDSLVSKEKKWKSFSEMVEKTDIPEFITPPSGFTSH